MQLLFSLKILIILIAILIKKTDSKFQNFSISFETDSTVIELTDLNLLAAIELFPIAIILYYVPWSIQYQAILPEYLKASLFLKEQENNNITLFKFDCDLYSYYCSEININYFPTIIVFENSEGKFKYLDEINDYKYFIEKIKKNLMGNIIHFNSIKEVYEYSKSYKILLINTFNESSNETLVFNNFAQKFKYKDQIEFISCEKCDFEFKKHSKNKNNNKNIFLLTKSIFKETNIHNLKYFNNISFEILTDFIYKNSIEIFDDLNDFGINLIKETNRTMLFIINETISDKILNEYKSVSKKYFNKFYFFKIDRKNIFFNSIINKFDIKKIPSIYIYNRYKNKFYKNEININNNITYENFIKLYLKGNLQKELKSEKNNSYSANTNLPYKILIGSEFEKNVLNSQIDLVFVLFFSFDIECFECRLMLKIFYELSNNFRPLINIVDFYVMNTDKNEIQIDIETIPAVYAFYKKNIIYKYEGDFNKKALFKWIKYLIKINSDYEEKPIV